MFLADGEILFFTLMLQESAFTLMLTGPAHAATAIASIINTVRKKVKQILFIVKPPFYYSFFDNPSLKSIHHESISPFITPPSPANISPFTGQSSPRGIKRKQNNEIINKMDL
jgi:hypothetical protein